MTRLRSTVGRPQEIAYVIAIPLALLAVAVAIPMNSRDQFGADDFCSRLYAATKSSQFGVCVICHAAPSSLRRSAGICSGSRL